jgi:hypothetical protein
MMVPSIPMSLEPVLPRMPPVSFPASVWLVDFETNSMIRQLLYYLNGVVL